MYYITLDLEWNQAYAQKALAVQKRLSCRLRGEVIQIGAVKMDSKMNICGSYQIIVKPQYFKKLHRHVSELTGISQEQMAARLLMHKAPLWETMSFDENGRATEDFQALVVGSGNVGQAVIKQIVMNGQFAGSHFTLTIFDPKFTAVTGQLHHESRQIFHQYDVHAYNDDARSCQMYDFLAENLHKLKYIVVCTGNDGINHEVTRQLSRFLTSAGSQLPIYICSSRGLQRITATDITRWDIFSCHVLCSDDMDKMAMLLNHSYCGNDKTPRENWDDCDYFSRMSSRASADYAPTFLKMAGLPADAIPEGDWCTPAQLENMAISEHERWNAFHFCMGFRAMTEAE